MRKRTLLLTLAVIVSAALFGSAQSPQTLTIQRGDGTRIRVTTDNYTVNPLREATFTGHVAISANGVTVLADRAVLKSDDNGDGVEYQVEGNVRVRVSPPTP